MQPTAVVIAVDDVTGTFVEENVPAAATVKVRQSHVANSEKREATSHHRCLLVAKILHQRTTTTTRRSDR